MLFYQLHGMADGVALQEDVAVDVGDVVDAKITAIDNENQKISLSIRALLEPEAPSEDADEAEETAEEEAPAEEAAPAEE